MRYFIELKYDGGRFHGWQSQDNSESIQEIIETGLRYKTGFSGRITGCGRTDAGVHASNFYAHFDHEKEFDNSALEKITFSLNRYLPHEIAVIQIFRVKENAHARFDATRRTYKYFILTKKDPFLFRYAWFLPAIPTLDLMNEAAQLLLEYNDFTSFSKLHSDARTNNCKLWLAQWEKLDDHLVFTITADRFLRNMVRAIVGTLVEVGTGKRSTDNFRNVVESKNRCKAGVSAPANGLFLHEVTYNWDEILPAETPSELSKTGCFSDLSNC